MNKLILQMQTSLDGFVSAARPGSNWQVWNWSDDWTWDPSLRQAFNTTLSRIDSLVLSRPMVEEGYIDHWMGVAERHPDVDDFAFARKIASAPKIVVTNRLDRPRWQNTRLARGVFADAVTDAKRSAGGDLICFGGTGFAHALLQNGLVDELQLYVNPTAIGSGSRLFDGTPPMRFSVVDAKAYACGIVVANYRPV